MTNTAISVGLLIQTGLSILNLCLSLAAHIPAS